MSSSMISLLTGFLILAASSYARSSDPETVERRTGNARVDALIEQLTPEEKVSLVHGSVDPGNQYQAGYVVPIPRMGIPAVRLTDGEAGVNVVDNATAVPSTQRRFNVVKISSVRLRNDVLLTPRVNILRDPVTGDFWQSYSEDPFLNAQLGVQAVQAIQKEGTMANPKQIGPSSTGASAGDVNSIVDMQTLQEVYWSAPGALLEAGAATLMCSYAQVNGVPACQHQPLFDIVRGVYNSSAIVMSDWGATHSTTPSIVAGLDWEMPTGTYLGETLYDSIYVAKNLSETYLDRALGIILNKYGEFGLIGKETAVTQPMPEDVIAADVAVAYDIAVKSGILLKNVAGTLPLSKDASIAVIGPNGLQYSRGTNFAERAFGFADREIAPIDAFRGRLDRDDIPTAVGVDQEGTLVPASALRSLNGTQGLTRNGTSGGLSIDSQVNFQGNNALPNGTYEWNGYLIAPEAGYYTISLQREIPPSEGKTNADYGSTFAIRAISINGTEVAEGYRLFGDGGARPWSNSISTRDGWDNIKAFVYLSAGSHEFSAEIVGLLGEPVPVRLCWVTPSQRETNMQAAISVAKSVDRPVLFAFAQSPAQVAMTLDDNMDELVSRVAAANPNTVLVLNNAEPITMPWLESVPAVLEMQYPGQEGSWATVDLLLGSHIPQGRLTVTYPTSVNTSLTRNPAYPGRVDTADGNATFDEGVNVGYRWYKHTDTPVLFPFGYGISYTSFEYSHLHIDMQHGHGWHGPWSRSACHWPSVYQTEDAVFSVSFVITNTGKVDGVEIPQVYIGPPSGAEEKYPDAQFAAIALGGFDDVEIAAGKSAHVEIGVAKRQLSFYDLSTGSWQLAKGKREVWIGKSAEDIVLAGKVSI